jgi:hypothetical protein
MPWVSICATGYRIKKAILIFAYNSTGKTRLSMAFKELGKQRNGDGETITRDHCTSTPSPKTCLPGTTTWSTTASGCSR